MNDINKDLAKYFKSKNGINRLMTSLKNKYISLSRISGTITLTNITEEESLDLGDLLGKRIEIGTDLKTSFKEITKKINEGKYAGFDWLNLFNNYFNEKIITKEEQKVAGINNMYNFFEIFYVENKNKKYINEIRNILITDNNINYLIKKKYNKDKISLKAELNNILLLLDNIPNTPTALAVYSAKTGDPHYLDLNKSTSNLFIKILARLKNIEYNDSTEGKISILSEINIYTDPLSNYVITYKLTGNDILNTLSNLHEVINLNLLNINNLEKIDSLNKKVFIFENPSILNSLKNLNVPIVITSGIPNVSLYQLLDKLTKSNNIIYYNGDFDPEGLIIAQKIKEKFPNLILFCYDTIDYNICKSNNKLSDSRLKKLDNININELQAIKNLLFINKTSAYQEKNINRIKEFIIKENNQ